MAWHSACARTREWKLSSVCACRWFPADLVEAPQATWLDIILYSREQLVAEREALPRSGPATDLPEAPWGIISIKGQVQPLLHQPMSVVTSGR